MQAAQRNFFVGSKDIVETLARESSGILWIQTSVILDELIFLLKSNCTDLFKVKIIAENRSISESFVRKGIKKLIDLKIINKKRTKTFTYEINKEQLLEKLKVKSLEELYISRTRYVSNALFTILRTKSDLAHIRCVKLYCHMKYMSQSNPNYKCVITYNYISKYFNCSLNTSKSYLEKLRSFNLIKSVEKTEYFVVDENNIDYVDNFEDNSVDSSVDNSNLHLRVFDNNRQNLISVYSNNQIRNIDKEIYGFSCEKGEEKEEDKFLGVPLKKTPPPSIDTIQDIELPKINDVIEEKGVVNVQSIINNHDCVKKRYKKKIDRLVYESFKQQNINKSKINLKPELKTFEQLIPYELNIIEYEDFIYRLEKRCEFKRSSNFIKKFVKKLSEKYSTYKFKDLKAVENYFCKALQHELLDTKISNNINFRYNYELDENKRLNRD